VVGHAATISPGEWITAGGEWVNDRNNGLQFKARFLRSSAPTTAEGIQKYLASGMIRGIGAAYQPVDEVVVQLRGFGSKLMAMAAV
jgi:exodeoxyribonuclease V alpha subunit